ncbi:hypothetical protein MMC19_000395 [Ptychographa xylographoides]|nr:hypothetical protein [Ptychographa xylographoides]
MPGGGCHAYFSETYFKEAKKEVAELRKISQDMGDSVRVVENKEELANLRIPTAVGAVVQERAAKLSPYKLVSWILEHLIRTSGLNLQTNSPVLSIASEISPKGLTWTLQTSRGLVSASQVLITTNGYTSYLLPQFKDLIVPVRGEMSALRTPLPLMQQPLSHTYVFVGTDGQDRIQDDYLVQRPVLFTGKEGGELMFGGGRSKARYQGVNVDNDDGIDQPTAEYLRKKLPQALDTETVINGLSSKKELVAKKEWTGVMGFSRDAHPWVGAVPDAPGLWLAAAYTGSGMPNAALSSQYAASLILAATKGQDCKLVEHDVVSSANIPSCYTITKDRMERARKLPDIK